jgi:hypothetical protein
MFFFSLKTKDVIKRNAWAVMPITDPVVQLSKGKTPLVRLDPVINSLGTVPLHCHPDKSRLGPQHYLLDSQQPNEQGSPCNSGIWVCPGKANLSNPQRRPHRILPPTFTEDQMTPSTYQTEQLLELGANSPALMNHRQGKQRPERHERGLIKRNQNEGASSSRIGTLQRLEECRPHTAEYRDHMR